jgi:hypothetical protein
MVIGSRFVGDNGSRTALSARSASAFSPGAAPGPGQDVHDPTSAVGVNGALDVPRQFPLEYPS